MREKRRSLGVEYPAARDQRGFWGGSLMLRRFYSFFFQKNTQF